MSFRANEAIFHASADALSGFMRLKKLLLLLVFRKMYSMSFRANEASVDTSPGSMRLKKPLLLSVFREMYSMSFRANEAIFHASADASPGSMRLKKPLLLSVFRKIYASCLLEPTKRFFTLQLTLHPVPCG